MKFINVFILSALLFSCTGKTDTQQESKNSAESVEQSTSPKDENLELGTLSEINFGETLKVTGMIDVPPQNKSIISTFMGGYIVKTPLLIGDKVSKGQLLVTLENPEFVELQQNYLELGEQLTYLKSEYERQQTLFDENITSEKNYLKSQSDYKSNLARYNGLKRKLQMLNISPDRVSSGAMVSTINLYAPIEGYVTKVNVSNGTYVSPNDVIMEIVDTEHIHLELSVFEKDIMRVKKGQRIKFQIPEASNEVFDADVHLVGTTIDETTRRVKIHGHVDNESNQFIVGMYVSADILLSDELALGLPKTGIISNDEGDFVFIATKSNSDDYSYTKVKVRLGRQNETSAEILNSDDLDGKSIVIRGASELLD
ncbi:efflux RND transporter periplasmic adaptor subunit [uncultured Winogradskyella sp.]|uniref:efflux RND transporter periplasmic adaptor subunit n=1 Tax=uncultured Winogradskyella sp. TaxID=395353 RepID=UPI003518919E